jgi:hypothetical protein
VIRSGQFSQIATVLQAGGEEGMWTFERYQRWIELNTDWVRPAPSTPAREAVAISRPPAESFVPRVPLRQATAPPPPADEVIEVPAEEPVDLAELAALAKKIEERNP